MTQLPLEANLKYLLSKQVSILSVSDSIKELLGFETSDFLSGKTSLQSRIHTDDQDIADILFSAEIVEPYDTFNIRLRQSDGCIRCVKGTFSKTNTDDGVTLELLLQDAKSLHSELNNQALMTNFNAMMENTDDYIYFKDRNHVFTGASETLVDLTDPSECWSDLLGQTDYDVFPEEYADIYYHLEKLVFAGVDVAHEVQAILDNDGNKGWVDNRKYPMYDENGETIGLFGIARDITELKQTEEALQKSTDKFQTIFEGAPLGVAVIDSLTGHIYDANPAYSMVAGRSISELRTLDWMKITHPDDIQPDLDNMAKMNSGKSSGFSMQKRYIQPDSSIRWINMTIAPMQVEDISKPCHLCMIEDITESKKIELSLQQSEERLMRAQKYAKIGYWELLTDQKTAYWSKQMYTLFGLSPEVRPGPESLCEVVDESDFPAFIASVKKSFATGKEHHVEYRIKRPNDGEERWIECRGKVLLDEKGSPEKISGFIQDITERKLAEEKLKLSSRVFSDTQEGIIITDANKLIVDVNPAFSNITGYSSEEIIGKNPSILSSGKQSPEFYTDMWKNIEEYGQWQGEIWNRNKEGQLYAELLAISTLYNESGDAVNYVGVFSDITHSKRQQDKLDLMAHYDVLTQLPNRVLLADRFHQASAHSKRTGHQLAICFLDLDHFKPINDKFGHETGDHILVQVANRIKDSIRDEDTVSRQGGDEFALLLGEIESFSQCEDFLSRLLSSISEPYIINGVTHHLSASVGVTLFPFDDSDLDTLLRHADLAMYQAKLLGRNRYHLFSIEQDQKDAYKYNRLGEIQHALTSNELCLYYQPKVDMETGLVFGAEALMRWNHPEKGLIPPLDFLPIIEGTDLEIKIGNWVIEQALVQLEQWQAQGIKLEVSVNIASFHLQSFSFIEGLETALAKHPTIDHKYLQLEILESSSLSDINNVSSIVRTCQEALGTNVALDDFGTGYSSLTHLRSLPANIVKIDQSFIRDMLDDPDDYAIIDGVLGLADAFNRKVIAEGVETTEHGLMLLIMGCHQAQGYGIAKPIPADDFSEWLSNYRPNQEWIACANKARSNKENKVKLFRLVTEQWIGKFKAGVNVSTDVSSHLPIMNSEQCHCGAWIRRGKQEQLFERKWLDKLTETHGSVHFIANELLKQHSNGDIDAAVTGLKELELAFDKMSNTLGMCE